MIPIPETKSLSPPPSSFHGSPAISRILTPLIQNSIWERISPSKKILFSQSVFVIENSQERGNQLKLKAVLRCVLLTCRLEVILEYFIPQSINPKSISLTLVRTHGTCCCIASIIILPLLRPILLSWFYLLHWLHSYHLPQNSMLTFGEKNLLKKFLWKLFIFFFRAPMFRIHCSKKKGKVFL